jgi:hypothetical protein
MSYVQLNPPYPAFTKKTIPFFLSLIMSGHASRIVRSLYRAHATRKPVRMQLLTPAPVAATLDVTRGVSASLSSARRLAPTPHQNTCCTAGVSKCHVLQHRLHTTLSTTLHTNMFSYQQKSSTLSSHKQQQSSKTLNAQEDMLDQTQSVQTPHQPSSAIDNSAIGHKKGCDGDQPYVATCTGCGSDIHLGSTQWQAFNEAPRPHDMAAPPVTKYRPKRIILIRHGESMVCLPRMICVVLLDCMYTHGDLCTHIYADMYCLYSVLYPLSCCPFCYPSIYLSI